MAEEVRFELTKGYPLPVFKTGAIDHSATLPYTICNRRPVHSTSLVTSMSERNYNAKSF